MKNRIVSQHTKLDADYVDLRSLFRSLAHNKWFIIAIGLLIFTIAIIYSTFKPTKYQSSILLKIQHKQHNVLGTITNPNHQLGIANMPEEPLAVQIALIQSEFILGPVIKKLGLDINVSPYKSSLLDYLHMNNTGTVKISTLEIPPTYLNTALRLTVDTNKQYSLYNPSGALLLQGTQGQLAANPNDIAVKIDAINAPVHSQFILTKDQEFEILKKIRANLLITDLSGGSENNTNKTAILRVSLIGHNPHQIMQTLNQIAMITQQQNIQLKKIEADKTLIFIKHQLPLIQKSLKEAEAKLNDHRSQNGRIDAKFQTEYLLSHLSELNKKIEALHLQKINLLQKYTANHPSVISINHELDALEKNQLQLNAQLKKLPATEQEALNLKRQVDVKNNLYMLLLNQIHQLEIIKTGIMSDIEILSYASTPYLLQPVKTSIIGLFGFVIGLILGCIGVLGWRVLIQRIDDPHWTEHAWNIKNLASIPYSKQQMHYSQTSKAQPHKQLPLLAYQTPNDSAIESLCVLRTYIQLRLKHTQNNIIAIMGMSNGVGKTFISANLAFLLARIGNKVLLIDGDIRGGHMNQYFNTTVTLGLTDVMQGSLSIEEAIIQPPHCDNLAYLPAGTKSEKAADLLICDDFKTLLLGLSKHYQYVFINTPPNMVYSDNFLIGSHAGMNLFVLGAQMHEASEIDAVITKLNRAGIQLHGCIFNHLKPGKQKHYRTPSRLINDLSMPH